MDFQAREIINGSLLRQFVNNYISIMVNIENVESNGTMLKGQTTDNIEVKIRLSQPTTAPVIGWTEIIGKSIGSNGVQGDKVISFESKEDAAPFDTDSHNMLINFLHNAPDVYKTE